MKDEGSTKSDRIAASFECLNREIRVSPVCACARAPDFAGRTATSNLATTVLQIYTTSAISDTETI